MQKAIDTKAAPAAVGPYSQGVLFDHLLFVSGQLGLTVKGNLAGEDVTSQTRQALENIKAILKAAGMGFEDVLKTTVFLTSMDDFALVNSIYQDYFVAPYPARACIEISRLPKDGKVEIEVVAAKNGE
jgi:2-iminobutanoate/2-iminopropanoate deaminase